MWPKQGLVVEFVGDRTAENARLAASIKTKLTESPAQVYGGRVPRVQTSTETRTDITELARMALTRLFLSPSGCRDSIEPLLRSGQANPLRSLRYLAGMVTALEETRRARKTQDIHLADRGLFQLLWRMHRTGRDSTLEWADSLANLHYPIFDPDVVVCLSSENSSVEAFVSEVGDALGTDMQVVTVDGVTAESVGESTDQILAAWGGGPVRASWVESATLQGPYREKVWWG